MVFSHKLFEQLFALLLDFEFVLFFDVGHFIKPSLDVLSFNNPIIGLHLLTRANDPQTLTE